MVIVLNIVNFLLQLSSIFDYLYLLDKLDKLVLDSVFASAAGEVGNQRDGFCFK